jgi:hypothetical protein
VFSSSIANYYDSSQSGNLCATGWRKSSYLKMFDLWDWKINVQIETNFFFHFISKIWDLHVHNIYESISKFTFCKLSFARVTKSGLKTKRSEQAETQSLLYRLQYVCSLCEWLTAISATYTVVTDEIFSIFMVLTTYSSHLKSFT